MAPETSGNDGPRTRARPYEARRWWASPVLALFLLAPTLGEALSGAVPTFLYVLPPVLLWFALLYGCGALLCREAVVRWGRGWGSLLLLGLAYGIVEEGLALGSLFDPEWGEGMGALVDYGRAFGVNWVWTDYLLRFHALVSIAASVALTGVLFPEARGRPWLGRRGMALCALGPLVWVVIGRADAAYRPQPILLAVSAAVAAALVFAAWRWPTRRVRPERRELEVPRPRRFGLLGIAAGTLLILLPWVAAETDVVPPVVVVVFGAGLTGLVLELVRRWSGSGRDWDDRHVLALIWGGVTFLTVANPLLAPFVHVAFWRLWVRVRGRAAADPHAMGETNAL